MVLVALLRRKDNEGKFKFLPVIGMTEKSILYLHYDTNADS